MISYDTVIGLEIHVALLTKSKFLCGCKTSFGAAPNSQCCPICLGLPGALPLINEKAVEFGTKAGIALGCQIHHFSRFDRKNYFYPDLPKAYQITQDAYPLCTEGFLEYYVDNELHRTEITRIHLEEEAGKLIHSGQSIVGSEYSLVDYNRAGIPLIEIVTAPDIHHPKQARLCLEQLRLLMQYIGVSDTKMEEGSLRCDANISLKPRGSSVLGTKVEIKNLNSFRAIERALEYEELRQSKVLGRGDIIRQESRTWDERAGKTMSMRSKGDAPDYRIFPEPDLPPLNLDPVWVELIAANVPELPLARLRRLEGDYGLSRYDAVFLVNYPDFCELFFQLAEQGLKHEAIVNFLMGDYARLARENGHLSTKRIIELLTIVDEGLISQNQAKAVLDSLFSSELSAQEIVEEKGLEVVGDPERLKPVVKEVLAANPELVRRLQDGETKLLGFFVGQVMRATQGKGDPDVVNKLLRGELGN
ncbi:MAG TPA: Asp-tRNA(Asn)/Glu-tRNA(Gln) amidotransferase subunit GatB [Limnochordia bacterium]|nr:Asp-tRNA(Asn)/Glu-tRNA(Gln) amidotransferase subunit GatB [Limnochordia bacterium]